LGRSKGSKTGGGAGGAKKGKSAYHEEKVKLEDVYTGKILQIKYSRYRVCDTCMGKGGENEKVCSSCKGKGRVTKLMMLGPGMYTQSSGNCSDCKGEGRRIDEKDKCKTCNGRKVVDKITKLDVAIEPGVPEDHDYIFAGESDEFVEIILKKSNKYEARNKCRRSLCQNKNFAS